MSDGPKDRESQLRLKAQRRGYRISRAPRLDPKNPVPDRFVIIDAVRNAAVAGRKDFSESLSLDEVDAWLVEMEKQPRPEPEPDAEPAPRAEPRPQPENRRPPRPGRRRGGGGGGGGGAGGGGRR